MLDSTKLENVLYHFYGVVVELDPAADNAYFKNIGVVEINSTQPQREQLYTLLHESGHVVAMEKKDFTFLGEGGIILNEIAAWEQAEKLIKSLEIEVDIKKWKIFKERSINSYIERKNE